MFLRRLTMALGLALLLAACGGGDDAASSTTTVAADDMSEEMMDESEETMTDEEMSDDNMSEEAMTDEEMSDDAMSDTDMVDEHIPTTFTVTITSNDAGTELPTPLAPGAYLVHTSMDTLFVEGTPDRDEGLEALAEDGDPSVLVETLQSVATVSSAGAFTNPDGGPEAGPALPGSSYSFSFEAVPGDYLTFATMFVQSNDWFFAPASSGISLFDGDNPLSGDISSFIGLWDAGTEVDETPGEGPNQAPRQAGPNTGEDQDAAVAAVQGFDGAVSVVIEVG